MQENKLPREIIIKSLVYSLVICFPISGFIWGFFGCTDCGYNLLWRLFFGIVGIVTATLALGHDFERWKPITAIYILDIIVFIISFFIFYIYNKRKLK